MCGGFVQSEEAALNGEWNQRMRIAADVDNLNAAVGFDRTRDTVARLLERPHLGHPTLTQQSNYNPLPFSCGYPRYTHPESCVSINLI